jgi:hypothetical protein
MDEIYNISTSSSRRLVTRFLDAINAHVDSIYLPTTDEEMETLAAAWTIKSNAPPYYHGLLLPNPADYYSGHKKVFAINVQATVDPLVRFRYGAVAAPGKTNDGRAYHRCNALNQWINNLPDKYFICADNAYPLTQKLLIPFRGDQANPVFNSSYNFYLSQLRIRVELAFGRLTTKFPRLKSKMRCSLRMHSKAIQAATRLHNFIIDNDRPEFGTIRLSADGTIDPVELDCFGVEPLPQHVQPGDDPLQEYAILALLASLDWRMKLMRVNPLGEKPLSMH